MVSPDAPVCPMCGAASTADPGSVPGPLQPQTPACSRRLARFARRGSGCGDPAARRWRGPPPPLITVRDRGDRHARLLGQGSAGQREGCPRQSSLNLHTTAAFALASPVKPNPPASGERPRRSLCPRGSRRAGHRGVYPYGRSCNRAIVRASTRSRDSGTEMRSPASQRSNWLMVRSSPGHPEAPPGITKVPVASGSAMSTTWR
jgi:hypothetical protein